MEKLSVNSTISSLIESKKSLKVLRTILFKRDTTIKEVFNATGYFYEAKQHKWIKKEKGQINEDTTFEQALDQLKGSSKEQIPAPNKELIETNSNDIQLVDHDESTVTYQQIEKQNGSTNKELIETNEVAPNRELIEVNVLNALGMTGDELAIMKQLIHERMANEKPEDIYSAVARLKGRSRKNKTYYISTEITDDVQAFCEELGVKMSLFVETALIEALIKYKK